MKQPLDCRRVYGLHCACPPMTCRKLDGTPEATPPYGMGRFGVSRCIVVDHHPPHQREGTS